MAAEAGACPLCMQTLNRGRLAQLPICHPRTMHAACHAEYAAHWEKTARGAGGPRCPVCRAIPDPHRQAGPRATAARIAAAAAADRRALVCGTGLYLLLMVVVHFCIGSLLVMLVLKVLIKCTAYNVSRLRATFLCDGGWTLAGVCLLYALLIARAARGERRPPAAGLLDAQPPLPPLSRSDHTESMRPPPLPLPPQHTPPPLLVTSS